MPSSGRKLPCGDHRTGWMPDWRVCRVPGFKALQIGFLTKVSFRKYCVALTCGRTLDRVTCPYYASGVYKPFGPQVRCRARSEMAPSERAWMRQATLRTRVSRLRLRAGWPRSSASARRRWPMINACSYFILLTSSFEPALRGAAHISLGSDLVRGRQTPSGQILTL